MPASHIGCQMAVRIGRTEGEKRAKPRSSERRSASAKNGPKLPYWLSMAVRCPSAIGAFLDNRFCKRRKIFLMSGIAVQRKP